MNKMKTLRTIRAFLALFASLFLVLAGCGGKKERVKETPEAPKTAVTQRQETLAVEEAVEEVIVYEFESTGKRDPFKPFIKPKKIEAEKKEGVPLTPLQKYDITQLKLTSIAVVDDNDPSSNRAMVEDPAGKGYVIKVGTYIGKNYGIISRILRNTIIITEEIQDIEGAIEIKEIPLTLEIEEGE